MFKIIIIDKANKVIRTYPHITKIVYESYLDDVILEGDDILNHKFALDVDYYFYSTSGNYTVSSDIIGTLEIEKEL